MRNTRRLVAGLGTAALAAVPAAAAPMADTAATPTANAPLATSAAPGAPVELAAADNLAAADSGAITVTARRREEKAQDVPIALSVVDDKALAKSGDYTLGQVQQLVPSLQVFSFNPRNTNINIRGLGSNVAITNDGLDNGVGVYVDNVYYARPGQTQFDLVDLDRIEVLRGPQGTLFGKNTTAGAINISSKLPSFTPEASAEASGGNYGYYQFRGSVSAPITDKIAFRLSAADTHHDGYGKDVRTGEPSQSYSNISVRGQLLAKPTDTLTIRLIGDYARQKADCCIQIPTGAFTRYTDGAPVTDNFYDRIARAGYTSLPFDPFNRRSDADSYYQANMKSYGLSGQVDWDLGGTTLTSVTAYRWWDWAPSNDVDFIGLPIITQSTQADRQRQFSQEVRLASSGTHKIDWVIGAYYFWQVVNGYGNTSYGSAAPDWYRPPASATPLSEYRAALSGFTALSRSDPTTRSYAGFGQATWHIASRLDLTGGLRFTHEDKAGSFSQWTAAGADVSADPTALAIRNGFNPTTSFAAQRHDNALTGLATLSYKFTPSILGYASYSRGNQSGGLNLTTLPAGVNVPKTIRPETVNAYEIGLKSQFLNRRLLLNLAAFQTDVGDYQSAIVTYTNAGVGIQYLQNVGSVRSRGFEADSSFDLGKYVTLSASAAYADATYRSYPDAPAPVESADQAASVDLTGHQIAGAPKFTYTLGADAFQPVGQWGTRGLEFYGHADYSHRSSYFTAVSNSIYSRVPGYGLLDARLGIRTDDGRWDLSVWARNLLDKNYYQTIGASNTGLITAVLGDPRTFGVTLRTKL